MAKEHIVKYRHFTFLLHVFIGFVVLSGLFLPVTGVLFAIAAVVASHLYKFDQLPVEMVRNEKLSALISGRGSKMDRIILHRGGCIDAPENTVEAIREAAQVGAAGVEFDLQFTADGVGILLHDDNLERTTDGKGDVRTMTYAELADLNAAHTHSSRSKYPYKVKIPTLEECLRVCIENGLLIFIDCKAFAHETAELVDSMMERYPELYQTAVVCSFSPYVVYTMRRKNPRIITGLTYRKWYNCTESDCVTPRYSGLIYYFYFLLDIFYTMITYGFTWFFCGNTFFLLNKESMCMNEVNWWKNLGVTLLPWTVNSTVEKQFCLDYLKVPIITDGLEVPE